MRRSISMAVVALAMLAGCDTVFGLDRDFDAPPGGEQDGQIDSPGQLGIAELAIDHAVAVAESATLRARVHGAPGAALPYTFTAGAGRIETPAGTVQLDGNGVGMIETTYTAGSAPTSETITATVAGDRRTLQFSILAISSSGFDSPGTATVSLARDTLFASRIEVEVEGSLRSVGVWIAGTSNGKVRLGLYRSGSLPTPTLVAELAPQPFMSGRNAYTVSPNVPLSPGIYWLAAVFEVDVLVVASQDPQNETLRKDQVFGEAMSQNLDFTSSMHRDTLAFFVRVAHDPN